MKRVLILLLLIGNVISACAQYAPQAGVTGTTAVNKSSNKFVGWANGCRLQRGWMHIENKPQGFASIGDSTGATGAADNMIVSLGDSGIAVLTFESVIYNGDGPDFAVFENGFPNPSNPEEAFLEFAFVEVSSDGVNYTRFPASSLTDTPQVPVAGVYMNARKINNLAGKYISNYGTPFDLQELAGTPGLDINNITHIRLIDAIGAVNGSGSKDKDGHFINDPYPTPLPGSGFDLDAVGAFYMKGKFPGSVAQTTRPSFSLYPNPVADRLFISSEQKLMVSVADITGKVLLQTEVRGMTALPFSNYNAGMYFITITDANENKWVEKITKL